MVNNIIPGNNVITMRTFEQFGPLQQAASTLQQSEIRKENLLTHK